jgi:putative endonuclease
MKTYYAYIMSNKRGTLHTGVTENLEKRFYQHKQKLVEGFAERYNINKLVYFEFGNDVTSAITREKQIKELLRSKKLELIKTMNPEFRDLSEDWVDEHMQA